MSGIETLGLAVDDHNPKSIELYRFIEKMDLEYGRDSLCFKSGGDGDNGEALLAYLDEWFNGFINFEEDDDNDKELRPCPFCGNDPEIYLEDETWTIECKHHGWEKSDKQNVSVAADIGVYSCAEEYEPNDDGDYVVTKKSIDDARNAVVDLWNGVGRKAFNKGD